ncbi:MAG: SMP-30/gluconolactonase/LRE family protein [Litorimonas sp.]
MRASFLCVLAICVGGCAETDTNPIPQQTGATLFESIGAITTSENRLIDPKAKIEKLGGDYGWSEGPVWVDSLDAVLFTDVPGNTIWKYKDGEGLSEYMSPSGAVPPLAEYTSSPGANGLIMHDADHIIVPDHGSRTLWRQNVQTQERTVLADTFEGKKLNSPNDAVLHSSGIIFFTDPPYGLKGQDDNPAKELDFNGVFALYPDGSLKVVDESLPRPNGVILSPDERILYVANSDPETANWTAYDVSISGDVSNSRVIAEAFEELKAGLPGNPDGMAMAEDGTIFATGPGGVWMMSPEGEKLGVISTGTAIANVTFGGSDGRDLYMTSHSFLARTRTTVKGHGF